MNQLYPDSSCQSFLTQLLASFVHFNIHLYTAMSGHGPPPTLDAVIGDFTEAAWTGYAAVAVAPGVFTISSSGHLTTALANPITFSNTSGGPVTALGYYVTDDAGNLLACAQFDGAPITIPNGGTYPVVPIFGDFSQYSS